MKELSRETGAVSHFRPAAKCGGFSLAEMMIGMVLLATVAMLGLRSFSSSRTAVQTTKISSEVQRLNEIVSVYLAEGGSVSGLTTPQAVIDRLKTVRVASEIPRNVGVMTGRGVDVRLVARTQTTAELNSTDSRVVWDSTNSKFAVSNTAGVTGGAEFILDDTIVGATIAADTRTQSKMVFNGANGWVWTTGTYNPLSPLSPSDQSQIDMGSNFDPTGSSPNPNPSAGMGAILPLPTPIITPPGGALFPIVFPTQFYLNANGAPAGSSILKYRLSGGPWIAYPGALPAHQQELVEARNFSTDTTIYLDSAIAHTTYYALVPSMSGSVSAQWLASTGSSALVSSRDNSNPASVVETDGTPVSDGSSGNAGANMFTFNRLASFSNVAPNTPFTIGQITYKNGSVMANTGATGLNLALTISMSAPPEAASTGIVQLSLYSAPNVSSTTGPDGGTIPVQSWLWPPNQKQQPVTITVTGVDKYGQPIQSSRIVAITSNEPLDPGDVQFSGGLTASVLSVERMGTGIGRYYFFKLEVIDSMGQADYYYTSVMVPHDLGHVGGSNTSGTFTYDITGSNAQSGDHCTLIAPFTNFSFVYQGVTYTLKIAYGQPSITGQNGWVIGDTLYVYEGAQATFDLLATFVTSTPP